MNFDAKKFLQLLFEIPVFEDLSPEWIEDYEERAAILEYDGGLSRDEADRRAFIEILERLKKF